MHAKHINQPGLRWDMWPSIIAFLGFLIFVFILIYLSLFPLIEVAINMVILYFIFLRIYTEIAKHGKKDLYVMTILGGVLLAIIIGEIGLLWRLTVAAISTIIISQIYYLLKR